MIRDETVGMLYVDGDVGRLVAVASALAKLGAPAATAATAEHAARILERCPGIRIVAVNPRHTDVVEVVANVARSSHHVGLVLLCDDAAQRARLARERGVLAVFAGDGPAEALATRLRSALAFETFERVTMATLLRVAAVARRTFALRVDGSDDRGVLWVEDGRIVHAEWGAIVGSDAVVAMLGHRERGFGIERQTRAKQRTVHFDIDVFLSSFDLPDDEPALELVEDAPEPAPLPGAGRARAPSSPSLDEEAAFGVLAVAATIDGVVSAGVCDAITGRTLARIGIPPVAESEPNGEGALWSALANMNAVDAVEDAMVHANGDAVILVVAGEPRERGLWLHVDGSRTNAALARLEARRVAAVDPGLHDLVLTFGAAQSELAEPLS